MTKPSKDPRPRPMVATGTAADPYAVDAAPVKAWKPDGTFVVPVEVMQGRTLAGTIISVPNPQYEAAVHEPSPWDRKPELLTYTTGALSPKQVVEDAEKVIADAGTTNAVTVGPGLLAGLLAIALELPLSEIEELRR